MTSMPKTTLTAATACLVLLASAALPTAATSLTAPLSSQPDTLLKDSDHKKVGELMGACIEAYSEREGRRDAEAELKEAITKKWSKAAKGRDPLSLSDDLAAALWYANDYGKVKKIKKGRIDDFTVPLPMFGDDMVSDSAVWLPKKYAVKSQYPLVLCVPDEGEKPEDHLNTHWAQSDLRDNAILIALDMPDDSEHWGDSGKPGEAILMLALRDAREKFAIDFDRVFLAGRGPGVAAVMKIADRFSSRFCGIIGRTGDAADLQPENLSNVPCFFAGGGKLATDFAERTTGEGHAERVLKADGSVDDVWAWMQTVRRRSNPQEVFLIPGSPLPNSAYWLRVPPKEYAEGARISAKADRASNTITIEATGVDACTLSFNDTLVDLDKPVKVICNGSVNEDLVPRNFQTMMTMIYGARCEPGRVYTAEKNYDIPAAAPKDAE